MIRLLLSKQALVIFAAGLFIAAVLPPFLPQFAITLLTSILLFAIFTASLDLLMGHTGLISLFQAVFWGTGGYTIGILASRGIVQNFYLAMLISIIVVAAVAAILGLIVVRVTRLYFMIITFAIGQIFWSFAYTATSITGGADGLARISRPDLGLPWSVTGYLNFYYLILVFFAICFYFFYRIVRSPFGSVLVGIKTNEHRMRALGYNTFWYKYICLILSAVLAGVAGSLYVYFDNYIGPAEVGWGWSAEATIMALIGGSGAVAGPIIGAATYTFLRYFVSAYTLHWPLAIGIGFILVVLYFPRGIAGFITDLTRRNGRGSVKD